MNPLITLAMPVYNVENYIEKSLLSALNQTYDNLEILVIDDKGQDTSMEVVRKLMESHPRGNAVKIIDHIQNQGPGATRNTAIDKASGEFLYIMDSDDEITTDCIETLYSAMKEIPVDYVVGSFDNVDEDGTTLRQNKFFDVLYNSNDEILNAQYNPKWRKERRSVPLNLAIWNRLYNLSFLKKNKIRCIPYQKNEDVLFTFQLLNKANSCRILSTSTYKYNAVRPGSTMAEVRKGFSEFQLKQWLDNLEFFSSYIEYIKTNTGDVSKYILKMILKVGFIVKRNLIRLNYTAQQSKPIINKVQFYTKNIKFIDIPKEPYSISYWCYINSPKILDHLFRYMFKIKNLIK